METTTIDTESVINVDRQDQVESIQQPLGEMAFKTTILEALAEETALVSPDGMGRTTIDASGNDMDD